MPLLYKHVLASFGIILVTLLFNYFNTPYFLIVLHTKPLLVVISGPTASGKTGLGVALAQHFDTQVVSADARQVYSHLQIGTARPLPAELQGVQHHLMGFLHPTKHYSAGMFEQDALAVLHNLFKTKNKKIALLVGGSGLYIDAVTQGIPHMPNVPIGLRLQLKHEFEKQGIEPLLAELKNKDFEYYAQVDKQNPARVLRALEMIRLTGITFTHYRNLPQPERCFNVLKICLNPHREVLRSRISERFDAMMQQGLLAEIETLKPFWGCKALQSVGYKEFFDYYNGNATLDACIEKAKTNSYRYAKRQVTWFNKYKDACRMSEPSVPEAIKIIESCLKNA